MSKSPAVTFMVQFTKPYNYVDYTNRKTAVDISNELSLGNQEIQFEDMTNEMLKDIQENVPEQRLNFRDYINYMNRSYATKEKNDTELTAVFNENTDHLTKEKVDEYKKNLDLSYDNESLLWQGVVSFDNNFLAKQGLYDKESNKVDQRAIKAVIRECMPNLMKKEGIDQTAFWWGNIHLNTDNIHVHFGISEVHSARAKVFNKKSNKEEIKGNFSQKSIKSFKSDIYNGLLNDKTKAKQLRKEQIIANLKSELADNLVTNSKVAKEAEKFYLDQVYTHLPVDKKWRYGSNAKDFAISKFYLNKYLDHYFEYDGKKDYQLFVQETKDFINMYESAYTGESGKSYEKKRYVNNKAVTSEAKSKGFDSEEIVEKRIAELKERLGNKVLQYMKENPPVKFSDEKKDTKFQGIQYPKIQYLTVEDLSSLIDKFKKMNTPSNTQRQELGIYRAALRKKVLQERKIEVQVNQQLLDTIEPLEADKPFIDFKISENAELQRLIALQFKSSRKLSEEDKLEKNRLNNLFIDPVQLPINKATREMINPQVTKLMTELSLVNEVQDSSILTLLQGKDMTKEKYTKILESKIKVLQLKSQINESNNVINTLNDQSKISRLRKENGGRFNELKNLYQQINPNPDQIKKDGQARIEWNFQRNNETTSIISSKISQEKRNQSTKIQGVQSPGKITGSFMNGLSKALRVGNKENMRAFMKKVRDDEREEREERNSGRER